MELALFLLKFGQRLYGRGGKNRMKFGKNWGQLCFSKIVNSRVKQDILN